MSDPRLLSHEELLDALADAGERTQRAEANLIAITRVCGMAGIGARGQSVLARVKDMHRQLGFQIGRAEGAEAEVERLREALLRVAARAGCWSEADVEAHVCEALGVDAGGLDRLLHSDAAEADGEDG